MIFLECGDNFFNLIQRLSFSECGVMWKRKGVARIGANHEIIEMAVLSNWGAPSRFVEKFHRGANSFETTAPEFLKKT